MTKIPSRAILLGAGVAVVIGALSLWLGRDTAVRADKAPRCGDGVVNTPREQCDGTALSDGQPAGARCSADCRVAVVQSRCGNSVLDPFEPCDGTLFRMQEDNGTTCSATCTIIPPAGAGPRCGDGRINQASEDCDTEALPEDAPEGARCSTRCTIVEPEQTECQECLQRSCFTQRAEVDRNLGTAGPLLECVLGKAWASWEDVPSGTCARQDLLTCYCGTTPAQDCATAAPSSLSGPCVAEVIAATDCTLSQCVAQRFMSPQHTSGIAFQYVMCAQDNCFDTCFETIAARR